MDVLWHYNVILDKREKMKKLISDYEVVSPKKPSIFDQISKSASDQSLDIVNIMKVFIWFNTSEDHIALVNSMLLENELRESIGRFYKE